jgi:hypothetical protein
MAAIAAPSAGASPAPGFVSLAQMNYACALKSNGQLKYVASPSQCDSKGKKAEETLVSIADGPHYACARLDGSVFLVASLRDCAMPGDQAALTLPPAASPVYFCALKQDQLLTYATSPLRCLPMAALALVVPPARSPVLAGIEPAALRYIAGIPASPTWRSPATRATGSTASRWSG